MVLERIRDEFEAVVKKQEVTRTQYEQLIDKLQDEIQQAITDLKSQSTEEDMDHKSVIQRLRNKCSPEEELNKLKKDLKVDLITTLGEFMEPDISKAHRDVNFDSHLVNQTILNHLYYESLFDLANTFLIESQQPDMIPIRTQFTQLHNIVEALKDRNIDPALNWVSSVNKRGSTIEFDLFCLTFCDLLKRGFQTEALEYGKAHLSPFHSKHINEFSTFMGCLLWPGENLETSPYAALFSPERLVEVIQEIKRQFCDWIGVSVEDPLAMVVDAGDKALPEFLEFVGKSEGNREEWAAATGMMEAPVVVELGREVPFHSVFVCPVNGSQSNIDNPPMLLPCNHMVSYEEILKLSVDYVYLFECPIFDCDLVDISGEECTMLEIL